MPFTLRDTVVHFLRQNPEQKFTARDIAHWIVETYPEDCRQKQKRSTARVNPLDSDGALLQQIMAEIGAARPYIQARHSEIKTTEGRPRKYYFTLSSDHVEIDHAEGNQASSASKTNSPRIKEHDLYPIVSTFIGSELAVYSKRIDEKRSRNSKGTKGNQWLYPDLVGIEDLSSDWNREIKDCVQHGGGKKPSSGHSRLKCRSIAQTCAKPFSRQ